LIKTVVYLAAMKRSLFILLLLGAAFVFSRCKTSKNTQVEKADLYPVYNRATYVFPHTHAVHIDSSFVNGNILNLRVNYSGGCKKHYFTLSTDGKFSKTDPPRLRAHLDDTVKTDACRQFVEEWIKFDLGMLRHPQLKSISILLADEQVINYSY
jgi:hypothetical protein